MKNRPDVDTMLKARVFLTRDELAARWNFKPQTLTNWAQQGRGPVPTKIGGAVRYRLDRVEAFEAEGELEDGTRVVPKSSCVLANQPKVKGSASKAR